MGESDPLETGKPCLEKAKALHQEQQRPLLSLGPAAIRDPCWSPGSRGKNPAEALSEQPLPLPV